MFSTSRVYSWLNSRSLHAHTHKVWFLYLMGFFDSHMALVSLNLIGGDCHFIQFVGVYLVFTLTFVFSGVTNSSQGNNWLRELIVLSQCFNHFFRGLHKLNTGVLIFKSLTNKHILYLIEFPLLAKLYTVFYFHFYADDTQLYVPVHTDDHAQITNLINLFHYDSINIIH